MRRGFPYLAVVAAAKAQVQTWTSTSYLSEIFSSTVSVRYGTTPVTPVPTSTAYSDGASYVNEPTSSSDSSAYPSWVTITSLYPTATQYVFVYNNSLPDPRGTVTSSAWIDTAWTSPTLATITLSTTSCKVTPKETVTKYTGKFHPPYPGQITALPTTWPTSVISIYNVTDVYARYTFTGTTTTRTLTEIYATYLSTITLTTTVPSPHGRNPPTTYLTTLTTTSSDWQLAYVNSTRTNDEACAPTPTVTRAAQCAPTNMLSVRDGYGVAIEGTVDPSIWRFPIYFPGEIIGIPGFDAGACCQLCLDNAGCAASEWTSGGTVNPGGCTLYYFGPGNASTRGTCGWDVPLEYYASKWYQPMQGSYLALGCHGPLEYIGVHDDIF